MRHDLEAALVEFHHQFAIVLRLVERRPASAVREELHEVADTHSSLKDVRACSSSARNCGVSRWLTATVPNAVFVLTVS